MLGLGVNVRALNSKQGLRMMREIESSACNSRMVNDRHTSVQVQPLDNGEIAAPPCVVRAHTNCQPLPSFLVLPVPRPKAETPQRLQVWWYMTCPTKKILQHFIFFLSKQTAPYVQTCMASAYGQGPVHTDLRQNTSVERECRTGRHVYEASIQIFKLTLLEKGSS